jgi:hypothetical protein
MKKEINIVFLVMVMMTHLSAQYPGTKIISSHGYEGCVELSNENTRVVLEPNLGGRIKVYEHNNKNILYIDNEQDGWIYGEGPDHTYPDAGRFDYGPEFSNVEHPLLFFGKWEVMITGPREARMISQKDTLAGIQLERRFRLDELSSHLECTQVIRNISDETQHSYHWSRTFAVGGGISLTPLNPKSRYPRGFLMYGPEQIIK